MYDKDCNGGLELPELVELFEVRVENSARKLEVLSKTLLVKVFLCLHLLSRFRVCGWRTALMNRFGWLGNIELQSLSILELIPLGQDYLRCWINPVPVSHTCCKNCIINLGAGVRQGRQTVQGPLVVARPELQWNAGNRGVRNVYDAQSCQGERGARTDGH